MDFRSARGAYVVLDATEITRDWYLAGLEFRLLRFLAREAGISPVVPASVVAEAVANHGREHAKAMKAFVKASDALRRVGCVGALPSPAATPVQRPYADLLDERLESLYIDVADPPSISHLEIVARAVNRLPPFDSTGSGYRDTLTWMTCVELAAKGGEVYLVSKDLDFAAKDMSLAPELAEEVANLPGSVTLVRHLGVWLKPIVPWRGVDDLREAAALARDEEVAALFAPWDMFENPQFTAEELGLPPDATIHEISYHGSGGGYLERITHEKTASGGDRVFYEFPIEFEVDLSLSSDDARQAGFIQHEGSATGIEQITTVVRMKGLMTVVHDERDLDSPLYFENFEFLVGPEYLPMTTWAEDPNQLKLPFEDDEANDTN